MPSQTKQNRFLQLITSTGNKVLKLLFVLGFFGVGLQVADSYYSQQQCRQQSNKDQQSWKCSILYPLLGGLGSNFLQAAITIFVLDIALKRETLKEIQGIINNTKSARYLKEFFIDQDDYDNLIKESFNAAIDGQEIKILCLFEDEISIFSGSQNLNKIREKIVNGCKIRILVLHPDSSLLDSLYQSELTRKISYTNIFNAFLSKLDNLSQDLKTQYHSKGIPIKGSIEVKFHRNLFSPIGYYSDSKDYRIAWMYFSHSNGSKYPAFQIGAQDLVDDADKHFEYLWEKAGPLQMRITKDPNSSINDIKQIVPYSSTNQN
ncbi:MAG: hypothetical protein F6K62_15260 [Sphaerospermopsis sp. SIO1G2]|nr:hypothetical protein [Sphaerospermopsis sp. SIO1G2]